MNCRKIRSNLFSSIQKGLSALCGSPVFIDVLSVRAPVGALPYGRFSHIRYLFLKAGSLPTFSGRHPSSAAHFRRCLRNGRRVSEDARSRTPSYPSALPRGTAAPCCGTPRCPDTPGAISVLFSPRRAPCNYVRSPRLLSPVQDRCRGLKIEPNTTARHG